MPITPMITRPVAEPPREHHVVPVPVELPGEDVTGAPFPPAPAAAHVALGGPRPAWVDLPFEEQIPELRLGADSAYFADFEHDMLVFADCPDDGTVYVGPDGVCTDCGREVPAMKWVRS